MDQERGRWYTKTYRAGKVGEKVKYFVPTSLSAKRKKTPEEKRKDNATNAVRRATRAVNEGFGPGDGWLSLEYTPERYQRVLARAAELLAGGHALTEEDAIWLAADHEAELLMDRARRECRKRGIVLRYLYVTSDVDKDTGELVRVHHHLIVPKDCVEIIVDKWGIEPIPGTDRRPGVKELWDQDDYTELVEYMLGQVRYIPGAKRYTPSRNLVRPEAKARRVISGAQLRPPKGCKLLHAAPYTGERECQYIRYLLPPEQWSGVRRQ